MLLGQFSILYALLSCLWSVVFFEYWKQREVDLAVTWGTRGVSKIQHQRPEFKWEFEAEDPVTGEPVKVYSPYKRFQTQLLQVPFALACILVLGSLVVTCNSLEIFINEVYNGPFKQYLVSLRLDWYSYGLTSLGFPPDSSAGHLHPDFLDYSDEGCASPH